VKCFFFFILFAAVLLSGSQARARVSVAELNARMSYWVTKLPYCEYQEGNFPSKDGCDDGDSVPLNGLSCAAGDGAVAPFRQLAAQACDAVKASQGKNSGAFYRSPKKRYEIENHLPTSDEKASSNDSAQGVWAYIAQLRDVAAFRRWTDWMKAHKEAGIWPRYCTDSKCDFNVSDCPMLDRLAVYLGENNPLCDLPPNIPAAAAVEALQATYNGAVNTRKGMPGIHPTFDSQINALAGAIDAAFVLTRSLAQKADDAKEKLETLTRVVQHQADFIVFIGSYVDSPGAARQDVAYSVYLLKKIWRPHDSRRSECG
jgi:hypothetical protein